MTKIESLVAHYKAIESAVPLRPIRSERDYAHAVEVMNELLDGGAANERHPLANLVATLAGLIGDFDDQNYSLPDVSGAQMLAFLMDRHGLTQGQLPEVGTQGVISELLSGQRSMNVRQIEQLRARFGVSADAFFPSSMATSAGITQRGAMPGTKTRTVAVAEKPARRSVLPAENRGRRQAPAYAAKVAARKPAAAKARAPATAGSALPGKKVAATRAAPSGATRKRTQG